LQGQLATEVPLRARRDDGSLLSGVESACVNCHRPSGLGGVEGNVVIPPITGRALFGGEPVVVRLERRFDPGLSVPHPAYDMAGFASALRSGQDWHGGTLAPAMPRYALDDAQLKALAEYLRTLSAAWSPGVDSRQISLATVLAPDVDPQRRQAFLATLEAIVNQLNVNVNSGLRQRVPIIERRLHTRRRWSLAIWELQGAPAGWSAQLEQHQREHPVFALLSGLGGAEWRPVHEFCEQHQIVDWFPSVDVVPESARNGRYNLYFSGGVGTEAAVIASRIAASGGHVLQLVGPSAVARAGAESLRAILADQAVEQIDLRAAQAAPSPGSAAAALKVRLASLTRADTLVLWLAPTELAQLPTTVPAPGRIFASASLATEAERTLPAAWRADTLLVQPLEIGSRRDANLERFEAWRSGAQLPEVDRRLQSEAHFAARSLAFTLTGMLNNLHADYLIERAEDGISLFEQTQVQDEIQAMMMSSGGKAPPSAQRTTDPQGPAALAQRTHFEEMLRRGGTTAYPRLSLGPGQRLASKGAYLEKLDPAGSGPLEEPQWIVP
jgi:mono/diheme cytochrome c family protein